MGILFEAHLRWLAALFMSLLNLLNSQTYSGIAVNGRCGIMVAPLDSGSRGLGSRPGRDYCVMFWGRTLYLPDSVSLFALIRKWVSANLVLGVALCLWISIPSWGGRNTPSHFILRKLWYAPLVRRSWPYAGFLGLSYSSKSEFVLVFVIYNHLTD